MNFDTFGVNTALSFAGSPCVATLPDASRIEFNGVFETGPRIVTDNQGSAIMTEGTSIVVASSIVPRLTTPCKVSVKGKTYTVQDYTDFMAEGDGTLTRIDLVVST
jgi:hypothetical protein